MNRRFPLRTLILLALVALSLLALSTACAKRAATSMPEVGVTREVEKVVAVEVEVTKIVEREVEAAPTALPATAGEAPSEGGGRDTPALASPYRANRMIIKNAELRLLVDQPRVAIDQVTQIAIDTFGYVLSSRTWYTKDYLYATVTIGVPSEEYETALRRLRGIAVRVLDEQASGTDVTDEYVDLESRLRNLEATESRIRSFLDQATTVEESLRINQELAKITEEIEEIKGRMNYLKDRSAYSTITIHIEPQIPTPTVTPTPTSTATPTPTPTPTPKAWRPEETYGRASRTLGSIVRVIADILIWFVVVLGPFLVPAVLIVWLAIWLRRRRKPPAEEE